MKIKNLAFFGIMAAIMGVAGTARADTTTVIASQAYVDAKDALKQNLLNSGTGGNVVIDGTGNVVTGITADGQGTVTVTKGNVDVTAAVSGLDLTDAQATGTGTVVKSVTQTDGQIAVTKGTIADADVASDAAIATSKIAFTEAHTNALNSGITSTKVSNYEGTKTTVDAATDANVVATSTANANLLKGTGLQKAVAYLKGNGAGKYTAGVNNTETANTGIKNEEVSEAAKDAWNATLTTQKGDDYLTTLAAVERRVQEGVKEAVTQAGSNVSETYATKNLDNLTDTGKANVSAKGTYSSDTNYDTGTVGKAIKDNAANISTNATNIATNTTNIATNTADIATNKASITTLNGDASTAGSVLKSIKDNAVTGDFDASQNYANGTIGKAIKEAGTSAINTLNVSDTATNQAVTAVNQTNGEIAVTRSAISYADGLDYKLSSINSEGGDGSVACVKGSPCTLTMFMDNNKPVYEWTNMDTESTSAVL